MKTALDTNILSSLWSQEPSAPEVMQHLNSARQSGALFICAPVYSEALAHPLVSRSDIDTFLAYTNIAVDFHLPHDVWAEAGLRYGRYAARRRKVVGEHPRRILADFIIGAHALLQADRLMTLDTRRYEQDFPELRLYKL